MTSNDKYESPKKNQQGIPLNENQFEIDPNSPIRKNKEANKIND
jgi:hypothetical protein